MSWIFWGSLLNGVSSEVAVAKGGMGRIRGSDVMNILMDLMGYAHKFGA